MFSGRVQKGRPKFNEWKTNSFQSSKNSENKANWISLYVQLSAYSTQLLDEVEHDIMNYQNRGLCYLPKPKAETDNTDTRFLIIHDIMRKSNSIIVLLYIFHIIHPEKRNRRIQPFCFWGEHSKGLSNQADVDMINAISAADIAFIMSNSQAIVNWLNALDQSDFS